MAEKGWLKKQLDEAEQEVSEWPEWKRARVDEQYEELKQYTTKPQDTNIDDQDG